MPKVEFTISRILYSNPLKRSRTFKLLQYRHDSRFSLLEVRSWEDRKGRVKFRQTSWDHIQQLHSNHHNITDSRSLACLSSSSIIIVKYQLTGAYIFSFHQSTHDHLVSVLLHNLTVACKGDSLIATLCCISATLFYPC